MIATFVTIYKRIKLHVKENEKRKRILRLKSSKMKMCLD